MAFALEQGESVDHAFHRIGGKQLTKAGKALLDAEDPADALHDVRKATKRVRALLRIVRPGIKRARYTELNELVRDAAQSLSAGRDAQALVVTFDALVASRGFVGQAEVRAELARRAQHAAASMQADPSAVTDAATRLVEAAAIVERTEVKGNRRVLRAGLHDLYRAARRDQRACASAADAEDEIWHDWRKRIKYLWHAMQLVEDASPAIFGAVEHQFHHLADALGDDHDLAVMAELVRGHAFAFGSEPVRERLFAAIADARHDLHQRALTVGARLLVERPDAFVARVIDTIELWDDGEELAVGGLADLRDR